MQLTEFCDQNSIIPRNQFGFRKGMGTTTAINMAIQEWIKNIEINNLIGLVFIDLAKAFETVNRRILIKKLEELNIKGQALELINNYLKNRTQIVKINGFESPEIGVTTGVPQGSVLGPLLFNIYLYDITDFYQNMFLFVDDLMICCYGVNDEILINNINQVLVKISQYFQMNKLIINEEKCKYMIINRKSKITVPIQVKINEVGLERVVDFKYLGIIIDEKLKFKNMAQTVIDQVTKKLSIIKRSRKYLNDDTTYKVVNAIIYSVVNYGIEVYYGFINNNYKNKLDKLFKESLKVINYRQEIEITRQKYNILTPVKRYQYFTCMWIWKSLNKKENVFLNATYNYNTRLKNTLKQPNYKSTIGQNSLFIKGVKIFNQLPLEIIDEVNELTFKKRLKYYLLEKN